MPADKRTSRTHHKRHGYHQKRTSHFLNVYKPFLPLVIILLVGLLFQTKPRQKSGDSIPTQAPSVLAYATNISKDSLLDYTNQRRAAASVGALASNSQLTQAAQAKANDMATRNYWSHNTPDGTAPWAFITGAGYSYSKAGENLACGFNESSEVITGWYNSPTHRDNLLNTDYKDVGFGVVNAENFNCGNFPASQQTIIVAMYGTPYTPAAAATKTTPPVAPQTVTPQPVVSAQSTTQAAAPEPTKVHTLVLTVVGSNGSPSPGTKVTLHSTPQVGYTDKNGIVEFENVESGDHTVSIEISGAKSETPIKLADDTKDYKVTLIKPALSPNQTSLGSNSKVVARPQNVSRIQLLTNHFAPLFLGILIILSTSGALYVLIKHSIAAHRFFVKGEQYILSHIAVDVAVIGVIIALYFLTRSVGAIL